MFVDELRDTKWLQSIPLVLDIYFEDIIENTADTSSTKPFALDKTSGKGDWGDDVR